MNPVVALGLFVGIPLALAALIAIAVLVPRAYSQSSAADSAGDGLITSAAPVPNPAALPSSAATAHGPIGGAHGTTAPIEWDQLTASERADIQKVVQVARDICGYEFAVSVGELPNERESAIAIHAGLHAPEAAILLAVDPKRGVMDIVTGSRVHRTLEDRTCEFALLTLRSSLQVGDLVGGVRDAVMLLAEHARSPRTLHLDEPV